MSGKNVLDGFSRILDIQKFSGDKDKFLSKILFLWLLIWLALKTLICAKAENWVGDLW